MVSKFCNKAILNNLPQHLKKEIKTSKMSLWSPIWENSPTTIPQNTIYTMQPWD